MKHLLHLLSFLILAAAAAAMAQDTNDYALRSDLAAYAERSDLAGYVTHASLSNYVTRSDLSAYLPRSDLAGYVTASDLAAYATLSDLAAYATSSDLDGYATTDDLASYATASDLAAAVASRLPATVQASGSNTVWHVAKSTYFDEGLTVLESFTSGGPANFENPASFEGAALFEGAIVFGGETRTNWNEVQSLDIPDNGTAYPTANDGFVWGFPDAGDALVYLPAGPSATNRTRTVTVRHVDAGGGSTVVYGSPTATNILLILTETNATAVFDWCPSAGAWLLR